MKTTKAAIHRRSRQAPASRKKVLARPAKVARKAFDKDSIRFDPNSAGIEETLAKIAQEVPNEDWDRLPADLTDNLDHYLYGTPKK